MTMRTGTKKRICAAVGALGLALTLGIVGGIERLGMPVGSGMLLSAGALAVSAGALWKGGWMR